eukprot:m.2128 g.2128  ORF g.2128 m.2128 type:complete len:270 (+) comp1723_c0_seq1:31-840(+)
MEVDGMHVLVVDYHQQLVSAIISTKKAKISPKHYFYVKKHVLKRHTEEQPEDRTLFVLNIPTIDPEGTLMRIFEAFGSVTSVVISTITLGSRKKGTAESTDVAHIVFDGKKAVDKVIQAASSGKSISRNIGKPKSEPMGAQKYRQQFMATTVTDFDALQDEIDENVQMFDDERERKRTELLASKHIDEQGWTLVTRAALDDIPQEEKESNEEDKKRRSRRKKKKTELVNFYKFQKLEAQKQELALKRKKFDESKHRMELLKSSRKFRPY